MNAVPHPPPPAAHGSTLPWRDRMLDFDALNAVIGTPELLALGQRYD